MIIVYDFKIPANDAEKPEKDEDFFTGYFTCYLKKYASDKSRPFLKSEPSFDVKILKKSVDLRQKEQKMVFKALIKLNTAGAKEDDFINLLNKIGLKAKKADNEEESPFNLFKGEEAGIPVTAGVKNKNIAKPGKYKALIIGMGPAGIPVEIKIS